MTDVVISQWVIYWSPKDYPEQYVARRWEIVRGVPQPVPTNDMFVDDSIVELRKLLPPGFRLPRFGDDDPCIVEVWL